MSNALVTPALIETFAHGWAQVRGLPPPERIGTALKIETGQPGEQRRYIFPNPPGDISARAAIIEQPLILLKAAIDPCAMAALLPPGWHVEQTGTTMTADKLPVTAPILPTSLTLDSAWQGPVFAVHIRDSSGSEAARGRMTLINGWAQHDSIAVAAPYQRRGLGTAVMMALGLQARARGIDQGLLNATVAGRALYQRLGWMARAPWTTAQIKT